MSDVIVFLAPLPPMGLRRNRQYKNNYGLMRLKDAYAEEVWCIGAQAMDEQHGGTPMLGRPWNRARLTLTWRHYHAGPDPDNALASCKALIDTLHTKGRRPLGIVVDDSPEHLETRIVVEKVRGKEREGVLVRIERVA